MSKIIVSWATEFNTILTTALNLKDSLSLTDWKLNSTLKVDKSTKEIWGSGLNIAYNLAILWAKPILISSVWNDFNFSDFLKENIDLSLVEVNSNAMTGISIITKDEVWNKIVSTYSWELDDLINANYNLDNDIEYWIVSASDFMLKNLKDFSDKWIKTIFDPANFTDKLSKDDLNFCFKNSDYLIVNSKNYDTIKFKAEINDEDMLKTFKNIIITYGLNWSKVFDSKYNMFEIPWVESPIFIDEIWAGDAYRAWILKWLNEGLTWEKSTKLWAVLASISTWKAWAQNHNINWEELKWLYTDTYWENL